MKKVFVLTLAILMLASCARGEKARETTGMTPKETAAPETTAAEVTGSSEAAGTEERVLSNDLFSFLMPEEFDGIYDAEKDDLFHCISVYDRKAKDAELGGMVFAFYAFEDPEEYRQMPAGKKIGELTDGDGILYDIVIGYPPDVQWDVVKNTSDSFTKLYNAAEEIAKSIESTNGGSFAYGADTRNGQISHPYSMANPWHEITEEEAEASCDRLFKAPEGAENIIWSQMGDTADPINGSFPLLQLDFDLDRLHYTARAQEGTGEDADISGIWYDWTVVDEVTLANWGDGLMKGKVYRWRTDKETVDLCTWYDIEIGISYTLSTAAPDLDGFDIQAIAEAMYYGEIEAF